MKGKLSLLKESLHNTSNNISKSYSNVFKTQVSSTTELIPYNNTKEHTFNVQTMPVQTVGNKLEQLQLQQRKHNMIVPRDKISNCAVRLKNKSVNNKHSVIHIKDITKTTKSNAKHLKTKMQSLLKEASLTSNDYDRNSNNNNNKNKNKLAQLERKSKDNNNDNKIKREIAKFTSNLRSSNSRSKNKPIINLNINENSRNYNSNNSNMNLCYSITNPKPGVERTNSLSCYNNNITSTGHLKRNSYDINNKTVCVPFKKDGIIKYNPVNFIKVAKIDLVEKKRKIKNDLDEFSNSFDRKNNSYIYMKYRNIKNKMKNNNSSGNIFSNNMFVNQLTNVNNGNNNNNNNTIDIFEKLNNLQNPNKYRNKSFSLNTQSMNILKSLNSL